MRGRPPTDAPKKNVYISVRTTPEQKEEIKGIAKRLKMSISELILYAISKIKA